MIMNIKEELLKTKLYVDNEYLNKYVALISKDFVFTDIATNNHHIIPYHILKKKKIHIYDERYLKKLKISDHILAHYYLFKCSRTDQESFANLGAINLILNGANIEKYIDENISEEEIIELAESKNCLAVYLKQYNSARNKGKIYINKDGKSKKIYPKDLKIWVEQGWRKGGIPFTEEHKQNLRKKKPMSSEAKVRLKGRGKGKISINKAGKLKRINIEDLSFYEQLGWKKGGRKHTEEEKLHISKINKGKTITQEHRQKLSKTNSGYIYMHKGDKEAHVNKNKLQDYLLENWEYGRAKAISEKIHKTQTKNREKKKLCKQKN